MLIDVPNLTLCVFACFCLCFDLGGAILTSPSKDSHIVTKKAPSVDAWVETPGKSRK